MPYSNIGTFLKTNKTMTDKREMRDEQDETGELRDKRLRKTGIWNLEFGI